MSNAIRRRILPATVFAVFFVVTCAGLSFGAPAQGMRLYVLLNGTMTIDKGYLTAMKDVGKPITIPIPAFLIVHPKGLVLFDTGMNPDHMGEALKTAELPVQSEDQKLPNQLKKLGYSVSDIRYVVLSHMHVDHAGGMNLFPKATFVVQKDELKAAWWPEPFQRFAYVLPDYEGTRNFNFMQLDSDWDLFGDGTIRIIRTIGHSQGHQSAVVKLPKTGTLILTGDAAFMDDNLKGVVPGIVWFPEKAMESIERIKWEKERSGGAIWFSHDPDFFKTLRLVPEYYE
jgi:glyoxylase-like metal-dependent hydrolase (beta-lactamase superfamily II)